MLYLSSIGVACVGISPPCSELGLASLSLEFSCGRVN